MFNKYLIGQFLGIFGLSFLSFYNSSIAANLRVTASFPGGIIARAGGEKTFDLLAYSELGAFKNAATSDTGAGGLGIAGPAAPLPNDGICPGLRIILIGCLRTSYRPPVGFRGRTKPAVTREVVISQTPVGPVGGGSFGQAFYTPPGFFALGTPALIGVRARIPKGARVKARAGAEADDPIEIDPGTYNYSPFINEIIIEDIGKNNFVGISYFATDSRFPEPLWALDITVKDVLKSNTDIMINFISNSILNLDNNVVENQIRNAFIVSEDTAMLNSFSLFNSVYNVNQIIQFEEGITGGVEFISIPERFSPLSIIVFAILELGSLIFWNKK